MPAAVPFAAGDSDAAVAAATAAAAACCSCPLNFCLCRRDGATGLPGGSGAHAIGNVDSLLSRARAVSLVNFCSVLLHSGPWLGSRRAALRLSFRLWRLRLSSS